MKSRRMKLREHGAHLKGKCIKFMVGEPERKSPQRRYSHRLEDNNKVDLEETGWEGFD
jgi:hypothetical protein